MYFRRKQSKGRFYLQIVESHRTGDQVRQRVIATLGRLDELESVHVNIVAAGDCNELLINRPFVWRLLWKSSVPRGSLR
jgi:hypothetical protein